MRPIHLDVEGLACFKEKQEIDFSDLDLFAICGPTGAGKSTLLDAVLFALYGEVPRVGKQDLKEMISAGRERVSVRFDFAVGDRRYRIARALRTRGSASVRFEEHDGADFNTVLADQVRTASQEVTRLLGLDVDAFTQAVILPQGEFARFLKADPRKRREMLRTLLRLDVYERMRQAAQEVSNCRKFQLESLEHRLRDEYGGVSGTALAELRSAWQEARTLLEDRRKEAGDAENRLIEIRERRAKTADLTKHEARMADLHRGAARIEEARGELETARRAADLVPLIAEADRATRDAGAARNEAEHARHARETAAHDHAERLRELARAEEQAQKEIPALRDRVAGLDRILGRLPEVRGLETAVRKNRTRVERLVEEATETRTRQERMGAEADRRQNFVGTARADLDGIGYDAQLDEALDRVREAATRLADARAELQRAEPAREQRRRTLKGCTADVERLDARLRAQEAAQQHAQQESDRSEEALHAAHRLDAANHLRESLAPGMACPVCTRIVTDPPAADLHPDVAAARAAYEDAGRVLQRVGGDAQETRTARTQVESDARAAHRALAEAEERVSEARANVRMMETDIRGSLGDHAPVDEEAIEVWFTRQMQTVSAARSAFEAARDRLETATHELSELRRREETMRTDLERMERERCERAADLGADEERLGTVRAEIAAVTRSTDPERERADLAARVDEIGSRQNDAAAGEARARSELAARQQASAERERAAEEAANDATARIELCDRRVVQARFASVDDVRVAVRDDAERNRLRTSIGDYERDLHAVDQRVRELRNDLGSERVSAEQLEDAQAAARSIAENVEELVRRNENLRQQVETLQDHLARAQVLRERLRAGREQHRLFSGLAIDLRSDRFQAYVLEDGFSKLVQGASDRLFTLSGERYALRFQDDQILVVDHDNADETRISDTLSGGETFLTSLSLALELSRQVQEAAGAVNLDSLFIDEGFGTLDRDTLATVSETIQSLQIAGRMVGIITHIPELRDEFSQQIVVTKHHGYSTAQVRTRP